MEELAKIFPLLSPSQKETLLNLAMFMASQNEVSRMKEMFGCIDEHVQVNDARPALSLVVSKS